MDQSDNHWLCKPHVILTSCLFTNCHWIFESYDITSYFALFSGSVLLRTWISAIIICYVSSISLWRLVRLQTVECSLTILFLERTSYSAFISGLVLPAAWFSATINGYVSSILLWPLVGLRTVICSLPLLLLESLFQLEFTIGLVLVRVWVSATVIGYIRAIS